MFIQTKIKRTLLAHSIPSKSLYKNKEKKDANCKKKNKANKINLQNIS